jgi:hypothetical protein
MTTLRYSPGTWQAVITPQGVALLPTSVGSDMLDRIWASLDAGNGLGAVLESLTGAFGTSLSAIPPFAVATIIGSEVRLAVRGELAIEIEDAAASASAPLVVSGADVTTWSERVVSAGRRLTFRTPETDDDGSRYGIASGVVLCSAVAVDLEGSERPTESTQGGNAGGIASTARGTAGGTRGGSDNGAAGGTGSGAVGGPVRVGESSESEPLSAASHVSGTAPTGMPAVAPAESDEAPETTVIPEATILPGDDQHGQNAGSDAAGTPAADAGVAPSSPTSAATPSSAPTSSSSATPVTASEDASAALPDSPERAATPTAATPGPASEAPATDEDDVDDLSHTRTELPDDAYDHLWGATVVKSVEEAAVRESDDDEDEPEDGAHAAASSSAPKAAGSSARTATPADAAPSADAAGTPGGFAPPAPAVNAPLAAASGASPGVEAAAASAPLPASGGLIDSVPNFRGVGAASGSDSVNGRTVPPSAASSAAASHPQAAPAGVPASAGAPAMPKATEVGDDHDGLTVTVSELEAMRRLGAAGGAALGEAESATSALGRIALSTGETYTLDRPVIIGRRPRANRVQGDQVPVLVTVASPEQDISRNHLEIRLEGRHVLVVDLATTNGSVLHREGTPPLRLGPNEPVLVLTGDLVDIGDGVTVEFEEIA